MNYLKNYYSAAIAVDGHLEVCDTFFEGIVAAEEHAAALNAKPDMFGDVDPNPRWMPVVWNRTLEIWQSTVEHEVYQDLVRAFTKPSVGE